MTHRIQRLKAALFQNHREISLERALLYTASHQQTEGEPVILRRAKATAYILEHVEISIRDEELIAGNRTVKPRAVLCRRKWTRIGCLTSWIGSRRVRRTVLISAKRISASIVRFYSRTGKNGR